jgi:pSer/pThr/pTyr-binding forkhead associated (FHA) protein
VRKVIGLLVQSGPLKGHKYLVKTDCPVLIGRAEEANIRLTQDKFCSRSQAVVFWDKNAFFLKDLESTNGTYVNKIKVTENIKLKNNDVIVFGGTEVIVFLADKSKNDTPLMDVM